MERWRRSRDERLKVKGERREILKERRQANLKGKEKKGRRYNGIRKWREV